METLGWCLAVIAFIWTMSLNGRVNALERKLKEAGVGAVDKGPVVAMLRPGRTVCLDFDTDDVPLELVDAACVVEDVDSAWVLLKTCKKGQRHLVRVDAISGVKVKER